MALNNSIIPFTVCGDFASVIKFLFSCMFIGYFSVPSIRFCLKSKMSFFVIESIFLFPKKGFI